MIITERLPPHIHPSARLTWYAACAVGRRPPVRILSGARKLDAMRAAKEFEADPSNLVCPLWGKPHRPLVLVCWEWVSGAA